MSSLGSMPHPQGFAIDKLLIIPIDSDSLFEPSPNRSELVCLSSIYPCSTQESQLLTYFNKILYIDMFSSMNERYGERFRLDNFFDRFPYNVLFVKSLRPAVADYNIFTCFFMDLLHPGRKQKGIKVSFIYIFSLTVQ